MTPNDEHEAQSRERYAMLNDIVEMAMIVLGFVWIGILIVELVYGLSPVLSAVFNIIWAVFIVDFTVRLVLAADKVRYLRANWLTGLSLLIPAIRILRVVRVIRLFRMTAVVRGIRLVRLITSFNRSARSLGATMRRRGFGYVIALTVVVVLSGAAGMYAFERDAPGQEGFETYSDALWWTAMIITTLGSQYWPATPEGRLLCLILSIYAFTVFGYITAVLASHFIGRDTTRQSEAPSPQDLQALQAQIAALRQELRVHQAPPDTKKRNAGPPPI